MFLPFDVEYRPFGVAEARVGEFGEVLAQVKLAEGKDGR